MAPPRTLVKTKDKAKCTFKCPDCKKILTNQKSYHLHIQIHTDDYPYSCDKCSYKCKIKKYLSRHKKKVHTKADGPQCLVCGKKFHFTCNLKSHMRVHTGEKPYICKVCGKAFSSTYCLSMHKLIHTNEKPFQCSFCEYACRDKSTLRRHEERHQGIYKTYPCKRCKKIFKTSISRKLHTDEEHNGIDTRVYRCDQCDKGFKSKSAVSLHIRSVHDKAGRVECDFCHRIVCKNNMSIHLKTHVDIRPYACSYAHCGKSFKDRSTLKKHTLIHFPEKQYQCDMCDSRFPRKFRLRLHRLRHEGKGYTCDYCLVSFSDKITLRTHIKREHLTDSKRFICDECGLVVYYKKEIVYHLKYGHGTDEDKKCRICKNIFKNSCNLKLHYMRMHKVRFVIRKRKQQNTAIKEEPLDECPQFVCNYEIQKVEVDDDNPDTRNVDPETNMILSDQNDSDSDSDSDALSTSEHKPEYADTESTLAYSQMVLQEDINRSVRESDATEPPNPFEKFFNQIMDSPSVQNLQVVDNEKLAIVKDTIDKMLDQSRKRREVTALEKLRRIYNRRIAMATKHLGRKGAKQIKYFAKSKQENSNDTDDSQGKPDVHNPSDHVTDNDTENEINTAHGGDSGHENNSDRENTIGHKNSRGNENNSEHGNNSGHGNSRGNENNSEHGNNSGHGNNSDHENTIGHENSRGNENSSEHENTIGHENSRGNENDSGHENISRRLRIRKKVTSYAGDDNATQNDDANDLNYNQSTNCHKEDISKNCKIKFGGHECYVCFRLFKTKTELKHHCTEHFDICTETMLKKCPYCSYVTSKALKKHIELEHKKRINYEYGHVVEKASQNGPKYVFDIGNCELEVIPSISNLNKIACMKIDEKNRQSKNLFVGKTKLVKKGNGWVVEREAVNIDDDYYLPEFSIEEYEGIKLKGESYMDKLKKLGYLAKKRGSKMLYPCIGCDKLCQTLSALKLHNRKHEENPKMYRPKVWKNRHIEYKTKNRKNKNNKSNRRPVVNETPVDNRKNKPVNTENRFLKPQPVKNNHKCDKELIDFYENNIKGGDIEFWQFLKIFNKMSRENVNDFKDLENRNDTHFGVHFKEPVTTEDQPVSTGNKPVTTANEPVSTGKKPVTTGKKPVTTESEPVITENEPNTGKVKKSCKKKFTRAIMISKKEYMRRNELKNQMRKRIAESLN